MKKKLKNQSKIKKRKNFFPTLFLAMLFWFAWGFLVYSTAPTSNWLIIGFHSLLFIAVFLTTALIFANSRRGLLLAIGAIGSLLFAYFDLANYLNLALFFGVLVCLEIYFATK